MSYRAVIDVPFETLTQQLAAQDEPDEGEPEDLDEDALALEFAMVRDISMRQEYERAERAAAIELGVANVSPRVGRQVMSAQIARTRREIRRLGTHTTKGTA